MLQTFESNQNGLFQSPLVILILILSFIGLVLVMRLTRRQQTLEPLDLLKASGSHPLQRIADSSSNILYLYDLIEQRHIYSNYQMTLTLGYTWAEIQKMGTMFPEHIVHLDDLEKLKENKTRLPAAGDNDVIKAEYRVKNAEGGWRWLYCHYIVFTRNVAGLPQQILCTAQDVTGRKMAELERAWLTHELRSSEERFRQLIASISDHIYVTEVVGDGTLINLYLSPRVEGLTGYSLEKVMDDWGFWQSTVIHPEDRAAAREQVARLVLGCNSEMEYRLVRADGAVIWVRDSATVQGEGISKIIYGVVSDITARKRLEEQLRKSQKMEAIGQLAGGVAHDFNNLLTAIIGNCELMLAEIEPDHPLSEGLEEIKKTGERAASLTRQLLAFSRKQVLEPKVLDLNLVVVDMDKLLRRLIGEDIKLVYVTDPALGRVKVDPGQIEQVIVNLAVNARDAMPQGGELIIETANVTLDQAYAQQYLSVEPGPYVMLAVRDTGIGMSAEIQARIFEPFFTTKSHDKGTGLGLATVYGIIQQSGGQIWVYSEPGQGATFKIYLPRVDEATEMPEPNLEPSQVRSGSETILLVEDEDGVRSVIGRVLQKSGYQVLEARHGGEALRICQQYQGTVHLVVTDVVMPGGISGRELMQSLLSLYEPIKVLYMSGYTDNAILHQSKLDPGVAFIQKPFPLEALTRKVRELLDMP